MSIISAVEKFGESVASWFNTNLKPWIENVLSNVSHVELATLLPIASAAAAKVASDLATSDGNLTNFGDVVDKIWDDMLDQMKTQGIQAGGKAFLTALNTAVVAQSSAVPLGGTAAPEAPLPPPTTNSTVNADGLLLDGPTLADWLAKGFPAEAYPPQGYAVRDEEPAA